MRSLIAALALSLPACATTPADGAREPDAGACNAAAARALVGRPATPALEAEARRLTGARRLRVIRPGDMVTMDYSPQRLNIHVGADGKAERFACG